MRATLAAFAALALFVAPVSAAQSVPDPFALVEEAYEHFDKEDIKKGMAKLKRAVKVARTPTALMHTNMHYGTALHISGDRDGAIAAFMAAESAMPHLPQVLQKQIEFAREWRDWPLLVDVMNRAIDRFPDVVRDLEPEVGADALNWLSAAKRADDRKRLNARLAAIGFPSSNLMLRDSLALEAAGDAIAASNVDDARVLVANILVPDEIIKGLTDRRFEPVWGELEKRSGPKMVTAMSAFIFEAERNHKLRPDSVAAMHDLIAAYSQSNQFAKADALAAPFELPVDGEGIADERSGWFLYEHVLALRELGRMDDADRRIAFVDRLDIDKNDWLIGLVINRVSHRVRDSRWPDALDLAAPAQVLAEKHGNVYAQQLVRSFRACALHQLGRIAEADGVFAELEANSAGSKHPYISALACAGRLEEAEPLVIGLLQDEKTREFTIAHVRLDPWSTLYVDGKSPYSWRQLAERPGIKASFDKVARELPQHLWPNYEAFQ